MVGSHAAHGPEGNDNREAVELSPEDGAGSSDKQKLDDEETLHKHATMDSSVAAQIIGVGILEFGVVLHR